jgi:hypothetical protein
MYMYVHMYTYIRTCMCICTCMYTCMCTCIRICTRICTCICTCLCICTCTCTGTHTQAHKRTGPRQRDTAATRGPDSARGTPGAICARPTTLGSRTCFKRHTSHHHTHTSHHHAHAPLWGRAPVRLAEPADAAGVAHGDVADARQVVVWPAFAHLGE